jgi:hypothetical protein
MSCWLTTYAKGAPPDLQAGLAFIQGYACRDRVSATKQQKSR